MRITRPTAPMCEISRSRSRTSSPRPAIGSSASVSGRSRKIDSISSSTVAVRIASDSSLGSSGANSGSEVSEASAVCRSPVTSPSRRSRSRKASGRRASSLERELPAVHGVRHVLLQDPERRVHEAAVRVPARQRGDVRELAHGQEAQQLELRVDARLEAAVRLEDELVAEDDRAVGLLDADRAGLGEARAERVERDGLELETAFLRGQRVVGTHQVDELARQHRVGEGVVDGPAVCLRDDVRLPRVRLGPEAEQQLVEVVRAGMEADLEQHGDEKRRRRAEHGGVEHPRVRDLLGLRPEPALRLDELEQPTLVEELEVAREHAILDHDSSCS